MNLCRHLKSDPGTRNTEQNSEFKYRLLLGQKCIYQLSIDNKEIFEFITEKAVLGTSFRLVAGILLLTPENRQMTAVFETVKWYGPTT